MTTKDFLEPVFLLFGRKLAKVPPFPVADNFIKFNFVTNQWELAVAGTLPAVQSSSNVGSGAGLALPRVADDLPFKSLVAGTGIVITPSPTEILIATMGGLDTFVMGYHSDKNWKITTRFGAMFTSKSDEAVEAEAQGFFNFSYTVREITLFVSNNIGLFSSEITLKRNSVAIPATKITIPALTTGKFSLSVTEVFAISDEIHDEHTILAGGSDNDVKNTSYYLECSRP